jgi:hypothetical protein
VTKSSQPPLQPPKPGPAPARDRDSRRAAALKANLARRKQAERAQKPAKPD